MQREFWTHFIRAAAAHKDEDYAEASKQVTRALGYLGPHDDAEKIAAGVLKAKSLLQSSASGIDDLEVAGTCAKSAISRLSTVWDAEHPGLTPLYKLASIIYGSMSTHFDMMAGIAQADYECPEMLDDIPQDIRPGHGDAERFREEVAKRDRQQLVMHESAASRMLENVAARKAAAAERLEQIRRHKEG